MLTPIGPDFPQNPDEGLIVEVPATVAAVVPRAQRGPFVLFLSAVGGISLALAIPLWPHAKVLIVSGLFVLARAGHLFWVQYRAERTRKDSRVYIRNDGVLLEQEGARTYWPNETIAGLAQEDPLILLEHVSGAVVAIPCLGPRADEVRAVLIESVPRSAPMLVRRRFLLLLVILYVLVALAAAVWLPTVFPPS